jgi:hypothetical protein
MTAMIGSADCLPAHLAATRDRLHRVAEHLLAAAFAAQSATVLVTAAHRAVAASSAGPGGGHWLRALVGNGLLTS